MGFITNNSTLDDHTQIKTTKNAAETDRSGVQLKPTDGWRASNVDFHTLVVRETTQTDKFGSSRPIIVPMLNSSIFEDIGDDPDVLPEYIYGRDGNPTRNCLENVLAKLEGVKHAVAYGSGTAAAGAVLNLLECGDGVVAMYNIYGGCWQLLKNLSRSGIEVEFLRNFTPDEVKKAIKENTKMVWLESPGNPNLTIVDIENISAAVHGVNKDILVVVDNTFLTPIFQRPITDLGADVCVYSLTKYLGGHNDIIMGAVTTDRDPVLKKLRAIQIEGGGIPSPFDCYLAIRSLKTLPVRMRVHFESCLKVAAYLETHPNVLRVLHPGLKSHENHELARHQQMGHSGMMGFYIQGTVKEAVTFLNSTKIVRRAASLGGDLSLGCLPFKATHNMMPKAERDELGITENYIRLSIGLESPDAIIQDLDQALNKACGDPTNP